MDENGLVVEALGLSKQFGPVTALDGLDLAVQRNSIFGFLGPNGAGKTTAMRLLLGMARPTGGRASVLGLDIVRDSVRIRTRVGYLPQHPRFYDDLTPRQTLRYARRFFPADPARHVDAEIDEVLELVGLTHKADDRVGGLSGGQRQRLGIAQAQIHKPELLILDEPVSALDPLGRRDVLDIMQRLRDSTTIMFSTHILDDVQRISDTVAILDRGRRVVQAPIEDLLMSNQRVFVLRMRGNADVASERLLAQPWVDRVELTRAGDTTTATVEVSDERRAESDLLRVALEDPGLAVVSFTRARSELEDVFVGLVDTKEAVP